VVLSGLPLVDGIFQSDHKQLNFRKTFVCQKAAARPAKYLKTHSELSRNALEIV